MKPPLTRFQTALLVIYVSVFLSGLSVVRWDQARRNELNQRIASGEKKLEQLLPVIELHNTLERRRRMIPQYQEALRCLQVGRSYGTIPLADDVPLTPGP